MIKFPSPNFDERPLGVAIDMAIVHYTDTSNLKESLDILISPERKVSTHYLIDKDGTIYQLVDDDKRAWHAGLSNWDDRENINNYSIGIELQNFGENSFKQTGVWPLYPDGQIEALIKLLKQLMAKYKIKKELILGHSDIAPTRKKDPGPAFPWDKIKAILT